MAENCLLKRLIKRVALYCTLWSWPNNAINCRDEDKVFLTAMPQRKRRRCILVLLIHWPQSNLVFVGLMVLKSDFRFPMGHFVFKLKEDRASEILDCSRLPFDCCLR